jgi:hypothetical protein
VAETIEYHLRDGAFPGCIVTRLIIDGGGETVGCAIEVVDASNEAERASGRDRAFHERYGRVDRARIVRIDCGIFHRLDRRGRDPGRNRLLPQEDGPTHIGRHGRNEADNDQRKCDRDERDNRENEVKRAKTGHEAALNLVFRLGEGGSVTVRFKGRGALPRSLIQAPAFSSPGGRGGRSPDQVADDRRF